MTNAAELRYLIEFQTRTAVNSGSGGVTYTPTTYAKRWAKVEGLRAGEFFAAKVVQSERDLRFIVRYDSGITPQMQIVHQTRVYRIEGIMDQHTPPQRWLTIMATEDL